MKSVEVGSFAFSDDAAETHKAIKGIIETAIISIQDIEKGSEKSKGIKVFFKPYQEDLEFSKACLLKAQEGIELLKQQNTDVHVIDPIKIFNLENNLILLHDKWIPLLKEKRAQRHKKNRRIVNLIILFHIIIYGGVALYFIFKK